MGVLHLWTFKTPILTELKKSKNIKSIMMVLLFPVLLCKTGERRNMET
jgi:hypothetical protein